ncbi:MAG: topoisomerase [Candidatus Saccharibacteria bacterium]|nr:topoisomerase [Candidatus Saccharibacteria bacterium]
MAKNLVIVESPAKAKTIGQYLGKDYTVKSSFGHIRDLPKKGISVDVDHNFAPTYEIPADKKKIVSELKKAAVGATVWLASDEDREGEAIAWHLTQALKLDPKTTKRIVFHEITKPAIERAIEKPRIVDQRLVDAQQARRILDRLVGYELSPVLWKKVQTGLSAGRVQSVAVRLIVERERDIRNFKPEVNFKVTALFGTKADDLPAELAIRLKDADSVRVFLAAAAKETFTISAIDTKPGTRSPSPPFTTSSLQQEAARRLGFSVRQTMSVAQRLYEAGSITYMRTDSTNLAASALESIGNFITKTYGAKYHDSKQYKTRIAGAQEAHEAIRPTDVAREQAGEDDQQRKLYDLIRRRAIASQMSPAQIERTEVTIAMSNRSEVFNAKGEILLFDGFFKVYGGGKDDVLLPPLKQGDKLNLKTLTGTETYSRSSARYSEASLVKKLEELGIGRPSTYAPTISTIQTRGYIQKADVEGTERTIQVLTLLSGAITDETITEITGADRNKLLPTALADMTTDFLVKYFGEILDYDFTAHVEQDFDDIADGKQQWEKMLQDFYKGFHPLIEKSDDISREEASQARELGTDPKTKRPVIARYGRYGPMLQLGEAEDEEKPKFASLPADTTLETVTLEQALEMFTLPRTVGKTEDGQDILADIGRYGPYIKVGKTFVSIKDQDPLTIDEETARMAYEEKLKQNADKYIAEFKGGLKIVNGPYGPYVTNGKKNAKIPKETDPAKLTEAQAKKLLAEAPAKRPRFRRSKAA